MKRTPRPLFYAVAGGVVALDQITKSAVLAVFRPDETLPRAIRVIPGLFDLVYVRNTGIAFGLFAGNNVLWLAVAAFFIAFAVMVGRRLDWAPLGTNLVAGLIVAGALGNLVDRALRGSVVDFLDFYWGVHHWPAFNVADSAITVAVAVLVFRSFFPRPAASVGN